MHKRLFVAVVVLSGMAVPTRARAQGATPPTAAPSPLKRTMLQTKPLVSTPGRDAITAMAELIVGGSAPRHTHDGEEIGYVLEGTAIAEVEGQVPRELKAGDTFFIPPNTPHLVRNTGTVVWKGVSTYLIEHGKPLSSPAPKP